MVLPLASPSDWVNRASEHRRGLIEVCQVGDQTEYLRALSGSSRQQTTERRRFRTVGGDGRTGAADSHDYPHHNLRRPNFRTVSRRKGGRCGPAVPSPRRPLVQRRQILYGDYALAGSYQAMASRMRDSHFTLPMVGRSHHHPDPPHAGEQKRIKHRQFHLNNRMFGNPGQAIDQARRHVMGRRGSTLPSGVAPLRLPDARLRRRARSTTTFSE